MVRLTVLLLLLLGPVFLSGLFSCDECNPAPYQYGIEDYRTYPRKINNQSYKSYLADTLMTNDAIGYKELELILVGKEVTVAIHNPSLDGSTAWACSPAYIALDSIKRLTITSTKPYAANLGVGSDLAAIITIGEGSYDQKLISEFLAIPFARAQPFFSLRFTQAPDQTMQHQFRITVDLGKGRINSFLTKSILIKP